MMKHSFGLLVATATSLLAGCQLYFGGENNDSTWTYCGSDGYYECYGNDCYWRGPECPAGMPQGTPPGFECQDHDDCAAGCYCGDNKTCEEAGFCTTDQDCGAGYVCNETRHSCEPSGEQPPASCATDAECATGEYCNADTLTCTETCTCTTDAEAKAQGFDYCDESRTTCLPGIDPAGDCAGEVTCNAARPACPQGMVALISEGCYTGHCQAIASCATGPACNAYGYDTDCFADTDCSASYTGINCRKPDNTPCMAGDTNCTCESFQFASCSDKTTSRVVVEYNGFTFDISELTLRN